MGRHKHTLPSVRIQFTLTLRPGVHDDLIEAFKEIPPMQRARRVVEALMGGKFTTHTDMVDEDVLDLMDGMVF